MSPAVRDAAAAFALLLLAALLLRSAGRDAIRVPDVPVLAFALFGLLVATQLVPLPGPLLGAIAPGPAAVWRPGEVHAAAVLGDAWRPVSLAPAQTASWLSLATALAGLAILAAPALGANSRRVPPAALVVLCGALVLGVYAVVARGAFGPLIYGRVSVPTVAPFGPFVSKNHFAGYATQMTLLGLGLAFGLARQASRGRGPLHWAAHERAPRVLAAFAGASLLCLAVPSSLSRGGTVSLAAGLAALLLLRVSEKGRPFGRRHRVAAAGVLGLLLLAATLAMPRQALHRLATLTHATDDFSAAFRIGVWRDTLSMVEASPLAGHGLGAYGDAFPRYKAGQGVHRVVHPENQYLEILAETGVLGIGLLVAGIVALGRASGARADLGPVHLGLWHGALAGLVALGVHDLFDFNLRIPSNAAAAALLTSVVLSGWPTRPLSRSVALAGGLAALVLAALLATYRTDGEAQQRVATIAAWTTRAEATRQLELARIETMLVKGLDRRPADAEAWLQLAWVATVRGERVRADALADHALSLDPQHPALREQAARLRAAGTHPSSGPEG